MEINWVFLVISANLIWAVCSIIDKIIISKEHIRNPFVFSIVNGFYVFLIVPLIFVYSISMPPLKELIVPISAGMLYIGVVIPYYRALEYDEVSKIAILFQLSPIFVLMISIFTIGEDISLYNYMGFFMLVFGGVLVSLKREMGSFKLGRGFYLMALAAFLSAVSIILTKITFMKQDYWTGFFWIRFGSLIAVLIIFLSSGYRRMIIGTFKGLHNNIKMLISWKAIMDIFALAAINYALFLGSPSLVSALGEAVYPFFVFIIALALSYALPHILKEEADRKSLLIKSCALIIIVIGTALASL